MDNEETILMAQYRDTFIYFVLPSKHKCLAPLLFTYYHRKTLLWFSLPLKVESLKTLLLITCNHGIILIKDIHPRKIPELLCFIAQVAWALIYPFCNISQRRKCLKKIFLLLVWIISLDFIKIIFKNWMKIYKSFYPLTP